MRDFPAGDPFVSLIAPELRAIDAASPSTQGADALGVTPPAPLAFDALTDLFLGGSVRPAPAPPASPATERAKPATPRHAPPPPAADGVAAEILIAGHHPVMASVWVQQYARDRAATTGAPVALIDLRTSRAWLQVLDPHGAFIAQAGAALASTLRSLKPLVRTWMIRVDEADEGVLRAAAPGASLTLLSGADQAATVGAYRAIKRLAAGGARPEFISIAVMGAEPADADLAIERVAAAAKSFLGVGIAGGAVSPKVDASLRPVTAFAGPLPPGGAPAAIKLLSEVLAPPTHAVQEDDDTDDVVATPPGPTPAAAPPGAVMRPIDPAPAAPTARSAPAAPLLAEIGPDAPLHVLVPGLEPLPARCPAAPGVRLASDAQGRLHLISIDLAAPGEPVAPHIERLLAAGAWATENHELLRVAFPRLNAGERTAPVLHLAVDQPKRVRHLLDTSVKLHVLASPSTGSRGWVARPLN